jgi:hypothetical protein
MAIASTFSASAAAPTPRVRWPEFIPKPYRDPRANFEKRWMIHAGRHRYVAKDAKIHPAVYERMKLVPGYNPPNLPGPPPPAS